MTSPHILPEPRFVNLDSHPVMVRDPQGHQRTVRPFRELQAFSWRTEADCVCVGQHYAGFPGLLSPFPEPEQAPAPAAQAAQAAPAGVGAAALPAGGRYKATGDVLRPDGSIKKDGEDPTAAPASEHAPAGDSAPADADQGGDQPEGDAVEPEAGEGDTPDEQQDRPLADVPGVSKTLATALRKAGYKTAVALAECQDEDALTRLGEVKGVKDAAKLAEAAQNLLGWEEEPEDES